MADFNIGLGISFDAMPLSPVHEGMLSAGSARGGDYRQAPVIGRPPPPRQHLRRRTSDQDRRGPYQHRQVQSVAVPQNPFRAELDAFAQQFEGSRTFVSPQHRRTFTHSAPTTPMAGPSRFFTHSHPTSSHSSPQLGYGEMERPHVRSVPQRMQPPPQPAFTPYEPTGFDAPDGFDDGTTSYYATPVMTTPFSDAGQFQPFYPANEWVTPQLLDSPVFDPEERRGYCDPDERRGYFDDADDMPEGPYVPTVHTQWPPTRPKLLARTTSATEDSRVFDSNPPSYDSPLSSPGDPEPKEKKVAYSRWSPEEDVLLREAIVKFGDGKWSLISQCVPGRTPMQCSTRWQGALNTSIHKGKWEADEDEILVKAVAEWQVWHARDVAINGGQDISHMTDDDLTRAIPWGQIASMLPRPRTGVQALARWSEALDPRITKGKWTVDEDMALMRGIARHGKCWIKIAQDVAGRTQRQCRTRYCQIADKKRKANVATTAATSKPSHTRQKSGKARVPSPREFAIHSE